MHDYVICLLFLFNIEVAFYSLQLALFFFLSVASRTDLQPVENLFGALKVCTLVRVLVMCISLEIADT